MKSIEPDPLLQAWEKTLRTRKTDAAIFETSGRIARTFAAIEDEAAGFGERLFAEFRAGEVVALQAGNHASWPALLVACLRKGLVVLPLERTMAEREREVALHLCRAAAVVTADGDLSLRRLVAERIDWGSSPPVLLKLTSGTTAAPRAIRFRAEQLLADCRQICDTMGITASDVNFGVIPFSHSYGFSNLITPVLVRGVSMVVSRDRMPRAVLDDLARTKATVFPGMPIFYQAFCEMDEIPRLPQLRLCISAGAPLPLEVAQKFRAKFGHPVHSFYGSSECGGICYDREVPLAEPGFVGPAMEGVQLEWMEPEATASRIRVRSEAASDGYFPEPDPEKLGGGSFTPDDLLCQTEGGLQIVGRISDVINVAGKKVNPAEVEAELLRHEGVRGAAVFGRESVLRNQEVAACVVVRGRVTETELLEFCRGRLSGWQVPKRIFFVDTIPVNERGKVSRRDLAQRFRV